MAQCSLPSHHLCPLHQLRFYNMKAKLLLNNDLANYLETRHSKSDCLIFLLVIKQVKWSNHLPRSVVRPTPLVRTDRVGLLRRLELARSTFEACIRKFSNSWDSRPNCSLWLRHFSSSSRTFDYTEGRTNIMHTNSASVTCVRENPPFNTIRCDVLNLLTRSFQVELCDVLPYFRFLLDTL